MIRKLLNGDIDRVADIWLKTNLKAHYFISNQYWKSNYELVKEMMSQSEVYVYEEDKMIQGFVGLNAEYIEGIFVSDEMQSCGIGKLLLDYVKDKKVSLRLNVYQKNARAISFYQREGFIIQCEGLDEATGEKDYLRFCNPKSCLCNGNSKVVDLYSIKLLDRHFDWVMDFSQCYLTANSFTNHLILQPPQRQIGFCEEISRTTRRI